MSIENKTKMDKFPIKTEVKSGDTLIGLQDNENVQFPVQTIIAEALSRVDEDILTVQDINVENGVTGFNPVGEVKEGDKRAVSGEEVFNYAITGTGVDEKISNYSRGVLNYTPLLNTTPKFFINNAGSYNPSTSENSEATQEYIPLNGSRKAKYIGKTGVSGSVAFYKEQKITPDSVLLVLTGIENRDIDIPQEANFIRLTFNSPLINGKGLVLYDYKIDKEEPTSFDVYNFHLIGDKFVYENGQIKSSEVITDDGVKGNIIYSDWNDVEQTFSSFVATFENGMKIEQPIVLFNNNGEITNYPQLIITK